MVNAVVSYDLGDARLNEDVSHSLDLVEQRLTQAVKSDDEFVSIAARHLVDAGGKRFRPLLAVLAAKMLERSVRENPKDSKGMAELGAYYLLADDRAAAEDLFDRSFKRDDELWSTVAAAGAYLGVTPQE